MIDIPKKIKATGHNCVVASINMVCMYWRKTKPTLKWNISEDFESSEWDEFFQKGLKYIKNSGMPTNAIIRYLKDLNMPLKARLEHLVNSYQLARLLNANIPPIVLYNQEYYLKGEKGIGHAAILVDKTEEMFITFDSFFHPKCIHPISKKEFEEAWKIEQNSTIVISPKSVKFRHAEIPSKTINMYLATGVVQR
jgi:hypothetical protein